ncbi:gamma-glutamylcyclotransferase (GGCT)/AIG2-like uncharacterized protein YtfP [Evansella vedderi]|uniref:Gamma-glutamylcyclotransferase family protein n=1 Tax=Evansella vedderi TaxID=38282 RepID=A0ABT9ZT46_9BACI|nr:gamma-glutamylcyclotransferase family protein [Evansella vedderi]MDQ0253345.1 gamma-glutamylcyclotransferase (GGCT)/AIG2-like uncharacterized protein YtfP [Evansella vedderi]
MENTLYVFVYGTLRVHEGNHSLLRDAKCVARHAWTNGVLYDTGVGYPAMATDSMERVYGEVYEITKEHLRCLDRLEGFAGDGEINHYERIDQTVYTDHGPLQAYVYVYLPHQVTDLVAIPSGDWKCHRYLEEEDL